MSKNSLYANEIASAHLFVIEHNNDIDFMNFLREMKENRDLLHSDRWSLIYDYMKENYPEVTGSIVTGLAYWVED